MSSFQWIPDPNKTLLYDPPSGWRYGFPKLYKPLPHETIKDTLRRDGYPEKDLDFGSKYCRFWEAPD